MKLILVSLLAVFVIACGNTGNKAKTSDLPENLPVKQPEQIAERFPIVIDLKKEYPVQTEALEKLADVSYISLGTPSGNLIEDMQGIYLTKEDVFVADRYCILRFGADGKFKNKIGSQGRGPGELTQFTNWMADTLSREIYMFDNGQQKTVVFDYDGIFKREFRKSDPVYSGDVEWIGINSLLVPRQLKAWSNRPMVPGQLFAEISKENGKELGRKGPYISSENKRMVGVTCSFRRFQKEVIVQHSDTDTLYSFRPAEYPNLIFKPRYILYPPVDAPQKIRYSALLLFESERFAFFRHSILDVMKVGTKDAAKSKVLMVDKVSGAVKEVKFTLEGHEENYRPAFANPQGTAFITLYPHQLAEMLEKEEIKNPQLRQIAEKITDNSNPVLVILKFKPVG